ncbi:MAG: D-sedoheptulose 7-phosphate isomerase [Nitrospirae bacterium]|nr:MAG: D-sedoheptulose 7-phosphate isomerase [Nitrospirota bacterium]
MVALERIREQLLEGARLRERAAEELAAPLAEAAERVAACLRQGGRVLLCGNGGSAADAQHIAAELVGRYTRERPGWAAIALTTDTSALTAIGNDYGFERVFARQVEAVGRAGDVLVGISTSGNSPNVLLAVEEARARGLFTLGLAGRDGGRLAQACDLCLTVPHPETPRIQEMHITLGHILCDLVEAALTEG